MKSGFDPVVYVLCSRPPRGGRGLKYHQFASLFGRQRRPPRGGRGLKYQDGLGEQDNGQSPPSRGAWIEMQTFDIDKKLRDVAPLAGGVD